MVSSVEHHAQSNAGNVEPYRPDPPAPSQSLRQELRDVLATLKQFAPEHHPAFPRRDGAIAPPRSRMVDVVDLQETRRGRRRGIRSPGAVLAVELLVGVTLVLAAVYGPAYYRCNQMKRDGMFYYGETVGGCVRDSVSARYETVEDFVRRATRAL